MTRETHQAAYPAVYAADTSTDPGMSLRDYFAAHAMQLCFEHCTNDENAAKAAYKAADAMLEARK